jgi:DnaJ-domain-containing protein 1
MDDELIQLEVTRQELRDILSALGQNQRNLERRVDQQRFTKPGEREAQLAKLSRLERLIHKLVQVRAIANKR